MENIPSFLGFAAVCGVIGYGMQRRTLWMWYLGWVLFYLYAGFFGSFFFAAVLSFEDPATLGFPCLIMVGAMGIWFPTVVWWGTHRDRFGPPGLTPKANAPANLPDPGPPE